MPLVTSLQQNLRPAVLAGLILAGPLAASAIAGENVFGLRDQQVYDVFVGDNDDGLSVLRRVDITGLRRVEGRLFLEIETDPFSAKRSEGLVLFDYVRMIIPSDQARTIEMLQPSSAH